MLFSRTKQKRASTYISPALPRSTSLLRLGRRLAGVESGFLGRGRGVVGAGFAVFVRFGLEAVFGLGVFAGLLGEGVGEGARGGGREGESAWAGTGD